jgi:hypothetical protein
MLMNRTALAEAARPPICDAMRVDSSSIMKMKQKWHRFMALGREQESRMARYHLYYLRQGMLVGSGNIEAADDAEAARIAREQGGGQVVEVWNDHRRVRIVSPAEHAGT